MRGILCLIAILMGLTAEARNFNTRNEKFAVYVRGSLNTSTFDNTLVSESHGNGNHLNVSHPYKVSGEFGVFFAQPAVNIRTSIEFLRPPETEEVKGLRSSDDVELYTVKSVMSVLIPKVTLEANLKTWDTARLFASAGYGYAMLTARNSYSFNSTGTAYFSGLTDFHEELTGTSSLIEGSIGYESVLADTTTFVIEGGYRSLAFEDVSYKNSPRNFQGSMSSGTSALNTDGKKRSIDLSGIVFALSFRFWL